MRSKPISITNLLASVTIRPSIRRVALATAAIFFVSTTVSLAAVFPGYTFLSVSGNGMGGNVATSQFSGLNGVINVTHSFSPGGNGVSDNQNNLIFPSQFTTLFPGTGQVQGHLAQTVYNHTSVITFDMIPYLITPNTVFGMWNTTDEVTKPAGGNPVYRVQLLDNTFTIVNPSSFNLMGNQDNQTQVQGRHQLVMNTSNGEVTFGATINGGVGTHTDAAFWNKIPIGTKQIIVYGDLPPLNNIGDGVGYYFAELAVPEPCTFALSALGLFSLGMFGSRRRL
jgi:hypothetical protein